MPVYEPQARVRCKRLLEYARELIRAGSLSCALCRAPAQHLHHHGPEKGMARKPDDTSIVPLCQPCHDKVHAQSLSRAGEVLLYRGTFELLTRFIAERGFDRQGVPLIDKRRR